MEIILRRLLGLYFVVSAVAFVPAAFFYFGVENSPGPWWILPAIPLAQGVVFAVAGFLLIRQASRVVPAEQDLVFPPVQSLLQLMGVYFIVEGLSAVVRPAVDFWFFTETWFARFGDFAAAGVWLVCGWILLKRPEIVLKHVRRVERSNMSPRPTSGEQP